VGVSALAPSRRRPAVHVTIDRLVLRGVPAGDRDAVAAALEQALGGHLRQLAQGGAGAGAGAGALGPSRALESLRLPELRVGPGAPAASARAMPQRIAAAAGRALAQGLAR
jgi:hypothetical protein